MPTRPSPRSGRPAPSMNPPGKVAGSRLVFFFNDTATTEIYPLSLHDALPICGIASGLFLATVLMIVFRKRYPRWRSEEHTSELQSLRHLVCRLLLEKKKN